MTEAHEAANCAVHELACKPLFQLRRDETTGVWQPEGDDPQFSVPVGDAHLAPGLYRFTAQIGGVGRDIHPCVFVADDNCWVEASRVALRSPLADGIWSAVIDIGSGVRDLRFDPVDAKVDFTLGPVRLERVSDIEAASFLIHAFIDRRERRHLSTALDRLNTLIMRGDMTAVRGWLIHGDESMAVPDPRTDCGDKSYAHWIARYDTLGTQELARMTATVAGWPRRPLISIVMPVYNTAEEWLCRCLDSVRAQAYPDWELCIADDASDKPHVRAVLEEYVARDSRIKVVYRESNGHISAASNSALELATGSHVALLDHDDELAPDALFRVATAILAQPQAKLFYSDEDKIDESGGRFDPYFKPDWSPDLFLSQNFISHLGVYETALVNQIGGFRSGYEGSQDYDLALRCTARLQPWQIVHIPHVLYHWRASSGSTALALSEKDYAVEAGRRALEDHFRRKAEAVVVESTQGGYRVRRAGSKPDPSVEIIVPTRDRVDLLRPCIESILGRSSYENFRVMVVDNQSAQDETLGYLEKIAKDDRVTVIPFDAPFNYSRLNNSAVARSSADLVVLLNNDVEVITSDWLEEMTAHASRPEVGAVGAKLYYPDDTIQHAGVVTGLFGIAGHIYCGEPGGAIGQMGRAKLTQNYSAVTAACLMLSRAKFNDVGGLNETLQVAFNDVDLCLKLCKRGYWNVWTPFAELVHHESVSRGREDTEEKKRRFLGEAAYMQDTWGELLLDDPAYNPNLSLHSKSCELAFPPRVNHAMAPRNGLVDDSRKARHGAVEQ